MGLDAESTDLTARIQRRRAALVAAGEVEPARPGEHRAFRGQQGPVVPAPRDFPTRGAHRRVVPLDETPERGGLTVREEAEKVANPDAEHDRLENPEIVETAESGVNEFGDAYGSDDDGFDLGDVRPIAAMTPITAEELDAAGGPPVSIEEITEIQSRPEALAQAKRKRTGSKRTALVAIDQLGDALSADHGEILSAIAELRDELRPVLDAYVYLSIEERLAGIEQGLLLLAEAVARQGEDDESGNGTSDSSLRSPFPIGDPPEFLRDEGGNDNRGWLARLLLR